MAQESSASGRPSARRLAVLDALRGAAAPLGVPELAARVGAHQNTVRFHLSALVADGLAEPRTTAPSGPGRPRTVYAATPGVDRGAGRDYGLLARILLGSLAAGGPEAGAAATEAGRAWGRELAGAPAPRPTAEEAARRLTALLARLGFAPEAVGASRIRLRHCPFRELAEEYARVVCPLHLGLIQGALAGLGAPLAATRLEPFAEPHACLAHLAPAPPPPAAEPGRDPGRPAGGGTAGPPASGTRKAPPR
ncbi:helix-turn-helix transcriptional regulator [Streptomyces hoynatensis]|uniref:helix-turn-helix transcriptional regulator n=1 Tax=Streptomyces hoynatensis TaxID=1141874 RepID=UPI001F4E6947|nr:helix-turn-helix domain-containing protein [Streptomyces hoynatensis]